MTALILPSTPATQSEECLCVVRLSTSYWQDNRGDIHLDKKISFMKKLCKGDWNILAEEVSNIGVEDALNNIVTNIYSIKDGLYEVRGCNFERDYETGYIDGYNLEFIPYDPGTIKADQVTQK